MPIRHTKQGYYWGSVGPQPTREKILKQVRAIYSSGYLGRNPTSLSYLNEAKKLIELSKREKIEFGAEITNTGLKNVVSGTERHASVRYGVPALHTHPYNKPEASTADILEMIQTDRPITAVGSMTTFSNRPIVSSYSISLEDRQKLKSIIDSLDR